MKVFIAGASLMANYDATQFPLTGVGMALALYIRHEIKIHNYAQPGRSTKSFIDQGWFHKIEEEIGAGDFLFIEFGHNDEKEFDKDRYTTPYGTYKENLRMMVRSAKAAGAIPVLLSPPERRCFMDASNAWNDPNMAPDTPYKLMPSAHTDYAEGARQVAEEEGVAFIDLFAKTRALIESAGPVQTTKWYMNIAKGEYPAYPNGLLDNTHLKYEGAFIFAGLLAEGLQELGGIYEELLTKNVREKKQIIPLIEG